MARKLCRDEENKRASLIEDFLNDDENLDEMNKKFKKSGIYPLSGDCGNFAYAMREVFGEGDFTCVFDEDDPDNEDSLEYPLHCYWNFNGKIWDANGGTSDETIADDFGSTHSSHGNYIVVNDCYDTCFAGIFDEEKARKIISIVKRMFKKYTR